MPDGSPVDLAVRVDAGRHRARGRRPRRLVPAATPVPSSDHPIGASGFPLGTFSKEIQLPGSRACPVRVDLRTRRSLRGESRSPSTVRRSSAPTVRGTYAVDGETVTIATEYPPDWGTSRHGWRMDGDLLWTVFMDSDVPEDKDWFEALDSQPWTPYPMSGQRILVVDDHAGFRATARRWLEAEGWTVVGEAADGASALIAAAHAPPRRRAARHRPPRHRRLRRGREDGGSTGAPDVVLVSSREPGAYAGRVATSVAVGFIAKEDLDGDGLRALLASVSR